MAKKAVHLEDVFLTAHRKKLFQSVQKYQRVIFIEALRKGQNWKTAMQDAGITCQFAAIEVYYRNSHVVTQRVLVAPEKVR